jgi:hypothetical protein
MGPIILLAVIELQGNLIGIFVTSTSVILAVHFPSYRALF